MHRKAGTHNTLTRFVLVSMLCLTSGCSVVPAWAAKPIKPAPLEPGDTIMFVAPAGELNKERMTLVKKRLEAMGFKTKQRDDLFRQYGYLGGTDEHGRRN